MARRIRAAAALALAVVPGLVVVTPAGTAAADVCVGVGRRIHVSGCTDLTPPPAYYAPLPEDMPPPPPPPPPVQTCVGYNGRWIDTNNCH
ncbi:hypothetical protein [Mycolicibacter longobardus]|uniref:RNA-binding protein n=1 Tax=Mycolicibacter longobardus TaxID=1108812 RepID=A0A1X1YSP8_9MYCO|nr:hypothetical protein [Mycolicibacter longobardus]MCV7382770.1 hypothetical protein [Mycolicibacter longobardus]ORW14129.1 hypothetical protein AWC16_02110 [Mycolicibacter longobardus]